MNPIMLKALHSELEGFLKQASVELLKNFASGMKNLQGVDRLKHIQTHLANPEFVGAVRSNSPHILPKLYDMANQGARSSIGGSMLKAGAFDWKAAKGAVKADFGPAVGSLLGAGLAAGHGINPLAGAAAGYGVGAIPEIIHGIKHRGEKHASALDSALFLFSKKSGLGVGSLGGQMAGAAQGAFRAAQAPAAKAVGGTMSVAARAAKMQAHAARAAQYGNQMMSAGHELPVHVGTLLHG